MLDTNIVIYVLKRRPLILLDIFNRHSGQMCISAITLAELLHGVEKSAKPEHNLRQVEDFVWVIRVTWSVGTRVSRDQHSKTTPNLDVISTSGRNLRCKSEIPHLRSE